MMDQAFILHTRAYKETSLLIELLTQQTGRVSVIAKGAKRKKEFVDLLPFVLLSVEYSGRGELFGLKHAEKTNTHAETPIKLIGKALFAGFYLNELLIKLLKKQDPHEALFMAYKTALENLSSPLLSLEIVLRKFEKELLTEIGYGFLFECRLTDQILTPDQYYEFKPDQGFFALTPLSKNINPRLKFLGQHLLNIQQDNYANPETLRAAKYLMRLAIDNALDYRPLKSRELWI